MQCKQKLVTGFICFLLFLFAGNVMAEGQSWQRQEYDLARTHYYPFGSTEEISFNDFEPLWTAPYSSLEALTADITGDGLLEVVTYVSNSLRVFNAEGQELWNVTFPNSTFSRATLMDVTGDGIPEIVIGGRPSTYILRIYIYDGSGVLLKTISKSGGYDSGIYPWYATDFNHDGSIEILALQDAGYSRDPRGASLFDYETGVEEWYYDMGPAHGLAAMGDIDEDGDIEFIKDATTVHNGASGCGVNDQATCTTDGDVATIVVDAFTGDEIFTRIYPNENGWLFHAISDLNRDGNSNILCFRGHDNDYPGVMRVFLLDDQGNTIDQWSYSGGQNNRRIRSWAIADIDNDNSEEIILCDQRPHSEHALRILESDLSQQIPTNDNLVNVYDNRVSITVADLNGDGSNDILITDMKNGKFRVLDNTLTEVWSYELPNIIHASLSDLNNDGILEVILSGDELVVLSAYKHVVTANFDIKPGSCPNPLNIKRDRSNEIWEPDDEEEQTGSAKVSPGPDYVRKAVLPVAILGTDDFDVTEIDPATILLEGVSPMRWSYADVGTPMAEDAEECACNSDDPDGLTDLTLKFDRAAIVAAIGNVAVGDTVVLTLNGELLDGTPITGSDCVIIVGNRYDENDLSNTTGKNGVVPEEFALYQNKPNPFNPITEINFSLPKTCDVTLEVFNIMGQRVTTLVDSRLDAGNHSYIWDASGSASGVYFYQIKAGEFTETKKMILLK